MIKHSNPVYFAKITSRKFWHFAQKFAKAAESFQVSCFSVLLSSISIASSSKTQDETILSKKSDTKKKIYPCHQTGLSHPILSYLLFTPLKISVLAQCFALQMEHSTFSPNLYVDYGTMIHFAKKVWSNFFFGR